MEEEPNQMEQDWSMENYFFKIKDGPREGKAKLGQLYKRRSLSTYDSDQKIPWAFICNRKNILIGHRNILSVASFYCDQKSSV